MVYLCLILYTFAAKNLQNSKAGYEIVQHEKSSG
jgi:hypothetical protein